MMGLDMVVRLLSLITWITLITAEGSGEIPTERIGEIPAEGSGKIPAERSGEIPTERSAKISDCCSSFTVGVQSDNEDGSPNPLLEFEDRYSMDVADFNGRPSWVSSNGKYGIVFKIIQEWI